MPEFYNILKWLHILAAIVALGANATYGIWLARSARHPEALAFTLKTIKLIDDRMANVAYALSLVTGLLLIWIGPYELTTPWLMVAMGLYALVLLLGFLGYSPTLRKQIQLAETVGAQAPEYAAVARRGILLGVSLAVLVVAIEFLMATKPALWG
jgi:uncharacterized membrane protein